MKFKLIIRDIIRYPLRLILFWLLLFFVIRLVLFLVMISSSHHAPFNQWPYAFIAGLRLDLSAACYLSAIPLLTRIILINANYLLNKFVNGIILLELFFLSILFTAIPATYKAWGTLVNARAFSFLADPEGIIASVTTIQLLSAILITFLFLIFSWQLYKKLAGPFMHSDGKSKSLRLIHAFIPLLLLPVGMRGGLQQIPVNESAAAWSTEPQLNHLAMNPAWFLANNIYKSSDIKSNPYVFMEQAKADSLFNRNIITAPADTNSLTGIAKPNIILIVLESWTADIIKPLGGDSLTTPFFSSLCDSGFLFTDIYASGRRTDQMFPSILCGYPAQPDHSVVRYPDKLEKLPKISVDLKQDGYHTSFYYGGELGFANMQALLLQGQFEKITGKDDFPRSEWNSKWGAHDEFVLTKQLHDLSLMQQPFFSMLLTLSTHEPFEIPHAVIIKGNDDPSKFRNAAAYTDLALKNYFTELKKQPWYLHSLIILVADHGHLLPRQREYFDPACHHIPLLITGGALQSIFHGKKSPVTGSQHDLAATILNQCGISSKYYSYSRDLLDSNHPQTAYMNMDEGVGFKDHGNMLVMHLSDRKLLSQYTRTAPDSVAWHTQQLEAYLQHLFQSFISL